MPFIHICNCLFNSWSCFYWFCFLTSWVSWSCVFVARLASSGFVVVCLFVVCFFSGPFTVFVSFFLPFYYTHQILWVPEELLSFLISLTFIAINVSLALPQLPSASASFSCTWRAAYNPTHSCLSSHTPTGKEFPCSQSWEFCECVLSQGLNGMKFRWWRLTYSVNGAHLTWGRQYVNPAGTLKLN